MDLESGLKQADTHSLHPYLRLKWVPTLNSGVVGAFLKHYQEQTSHQRTLLLNKMQTLIQNVWGGA